MNDTLNIYPSSKTDASKNMSVSKIGAFRFIVESHDFPQFCQTYGIYSFSVKCLVSVPSSYDREANINRNMA